MSGLCGSPALLCSPAYSDVPGNHLLGKSCGLNDEQFKVIARHKRDSLLVAYSPFNENRIAVVPNEVGVGNIPVILVNTLKMLAAPGRQETG